MSIAVLPVVHPGDDIRFLFKIVFEEVTEEEIRDYKINLNLKENGEKNDK